MEQGRVKVSFVPVGDPGLWRRLGSYGGQVAVPVCDLRVRVLTLLQLPFLARVLPLRLAGVGRRHRCDTGGLGPLITNGWADSCDRPATSHLTRSSLHGARLTGRRHVTLRAALTVASPRRSGGGGRLPAPAPGPSPEAPSHLPHRTRPVPGGPPRLWLRAAAPLGTGFGRPARRMTARRFGPPRPVHRLGPGTGSLVSRSRVGARNRFHYDRQPGVCVVYRSHAFAFGGKAFVAEGSLVSGIYG